MPEIRPKSSPTSPMRSRARRASTARDPLLALPFVVVLAAFFALLPWLSAAEQPKAAGFEHPFELAGWIVLALLAALHRPLGGATLGLGTLVLVPMAGRSGALPALLGAMLVFLLVSAFHRLGRRPGSRARDRMSHAWRGLLSALGALAPIAGAVLCGLATERRWPVVDSMPIPTPRALVPPLGYALAFMLLTFVTLLLRHRRRSWVLAWRQLVHRLPPLGLDVVGWWLGAVLAAMAPRVGWGPIGLLLAAFALLSAEAARNAALRGVSDHRLGSLERLQQANVRILSETSEMGEIAQQILVECRNVLPVQWFQLELVPGAEEEQPKTPPSVAPGSSWWAGPEAIITEGVPQPPSRPRALPGVHRRAEWRIIEHALEAESETLAVVRLWCDPRRVEPGGEDLLASLVPQMASSVHRARLDREAKLDPLTGVPVRRILERQLQRAYRRCFEEGRSMAVILCDIDFFKKVNDTYGHDAGDQALIAFAQALEQAKREGDLCCRYGGEEFTLLLEETDGRSALRLAERLRRAVEALRFAYDGQPIPMTMSAGVAAFPELHVKTAGELQLLADEALYEAKEQGRNRCLLNLGRGRFLTIEGGPVDDPPTGQQPPAPRFFH